MDSLDSSGYHPASSGRMSETCIYTRDGGQLGNWAASGVSKQRSIVNAWGSFIWRNAGGLIARVRSTARIEPEDTWESRSIAVGAAG